MRRDARHEHVVGLVAVGDVAAHRQVGRVDLQVEARRDDRLILGAHRRGDRLEVRIGRGVVLVGQEQRDHARRRRVHEPAHHIDPVDRRAQQRQVAIQRAAIPVADLATTHRPLVLRARTLRDLAVAEARERVEVLRCGARVVAVLEARQAVRHIGGVADLAHLAVGDEVDPRVGPAGARGRPPPRRSPDRTRRHPRDAPRPPRRTTSTTSCSRGREPTCVVSMAMRR